MRRLLRASRGICRRNRIKLISRLHEIHARWGMKVSLNITTYLRVTKHHKNGAMYQSNVNINWCELLSKASKDQPLAEVGVPTVLCICKGTVESFSTTYVHRASWKHLSTGGASGLCFSSVFKPSSLLNCHSVWLCNSHGRSFLEGVTFTVFTPSQFCCFSLGSQGLQSACPQSPALAGSKLAARQRFTPSWRQDFRLED